MTTNTNINIRTDLTKRIREYLIRECNFTEDEQAVFSLLASNKTRTFIADNLGMSLPTTDRRIRSIKGKVSHVLSDLSDKNLMRI